MSTRPPLPIDAVLPDLAKVLGGGRNAVLVAPPGAGKTTRVPLALLDAPWVAGRKILVLEPRRIAARGAASHMARLVGEEIGDTVGLRARLASRIGRSTRIEVITEGVFTRIIVDDPSLDGVAAVLFDEFHERSLDADLGLALARDAQAGLREDLRLVVMSATLDASPVAALLGDAPVIISEGRAFPVVTRYLGRRPEQRIETEMADAVMTALSEETGSLLAFLPGQGEIRRVAERLAERVPADVDIAPLHGALTPAEQDRAVRPAEPRRRKVVLATSIAETSLTIEGVRIVVDSGLARVPRYEPDIGVTRLETVRLSRAAADQRRGRAGRTEPGVCYRLWDEPQTKALAPFAPPEIGAADLSGLLLDCAAWGVTDPARLPFLDAPPRAALAAARAGLAAIGALDADGRLTAAGRRIRDLPLPPRLARMVLAAGETGDAALAADVAAILVERGLGGGDVDLEQRLAGFRRDGSRRSEDMRRMASGWARSAAPRSGQSDGGRGVGEVLAIAYPDRIAKARGAPGQFLLANGRAGLIDATDALARESYLVVAELQGAAAGARILLAARLDESALRRIAAPRITLGTEVTFDAQQSALRARRVERLEAIVLASAPVPVPPGPDTATALATGLASLGIDRLSWSKSDAQLRDRVAFLRAADPRFADLPDLSGIALARSADQWLAPHLGGMTSADDVTADVLHAALGALLPWPVRSRIDDEAPTHFIAPTGEAHRIDYDGEAAPAIDIRVQQLYGLTSHPAIAGGRRPLTLRLLSPAHRPIQITRDLPGFWSGSWAQVKAEMRGRYPRHPWPDDPANAVPTTRAKPRGT